MPLLVSAPATLRVKSPRDWMRPLLVRLERVQLRVLPRIRPDRVSPVGGKMSCSLVRLTLAPLIWIWPVVVALAGAVSIVAFRPLMMASAPLALMIRLLAA